MRLFAVPALLAVALLALPAAAADKLTVGKAAPGAFSFVPVDIGIAEGIFAKNGLEIDSLGFSGSAKLHQAMAAGNLDIGVGAGSDIIFPIKGAPEIVVGNLAGPPLLMSFIVPWKSPAKQPADLKGKRIGISTVNSLTQWLTLELARQQGWGPDGVTLVTVGAESAPQVAALVTGQIDALVSSTALGLNLAQQQRGRDLFPASDIVKDFMIHAIFASTKLAHDNPDAIRRFLKGWYETIAFMRAHKDETVRLTCPITGFPPEVEDREYDIVMPMFSADGKFEPAAMAVLRRSFVDLHLLDTEPDLTKYYTEEFLPKT